MTPSSAAASDWPARRRKKRVHEVCRHRRSMHLASSEKEKRNQTSRLESLTYFGLKSWRMVAKITVSPRQKTSRSVSSLGAAILPHRKSAMNRKCRSLL